MDPEQQANQDVSSGIAAHGFTDFQRSSSLSALKLNCMYGVDSRPQVFESNLDRWKARAGEADPYPEVMSERRQGVKLRGDSCCDEAAVHDRRPSDPRVPVRYRWPPVSAKMSLSSSSAMNNTRHSEPSNRGSANESSRRSRKKTSTASIQQKCRSLICQSWEYPLTNEDKKRRVLWLSELEIAARCDSESDSSADGTSIPAKEFDDLSNVFSEQTTTYVDSSNIETGCDSPRSSSSVPSETSSIPGYFDDLPESSLPWHFRLPCHSSLPKEKVEEQMLSVEEKKHVKQKETPRGLSRIIQHGQHLLPYAVLGVALLGKRVRLGG